MHNSKGLFSKLPDLGQQICSMDFWCWGCAIDSVCIWNNEMYTNQEKLVCASACLKVWILVKCSISKSMLSLCHLISMSLSSHPCLARVCLRACVCVCVGGCLSLWGPVIDLTERAQFGKVRTFWPVLTSWHNFKGLVLLSLWGHSWR